MQLIGRELLQEFMCIHADARSQLGSWEAEVEAAEWKTPHDVKSRYPSVSLPGNQQAIFNICWNKYRLWTTITYKTGIVLVKKLGTHEEYKKWKII